MPTLLPPTKPTGRRGGIRLPADSRLLWGIQAQIRFLCLKTVISEVSINGLWIRHADLLERGKGVPSASNNCWTCDLALAKLRGKEVKHLLRLGGDELGNKGAIRAAQDLVKEMRP